MTSLCRSGGSGDGGGGTSGSHGGRTSSRCGAVRRRVSGGGQMQLQRRQRESLPPQQLPVQLGVSGGGLAQLQRRPRETLTPHQLREWYAQRGASWSSARCPYIIRTGARAGQNCGTVGHTQSSYFSCLSDTWRAEFGAAAELPRWLELLWQGVDIFSLDYDTIVSAMYALTIGTEGACSMCVLPDLGIEAAALGASESPLYGTAPAKALHTFTLDSTTSHCFFRDSTTLTPLSAPVPVRLADPSGGPVLARSSTVLPCPAVPSTSLSGLHLPSFSTNLVSTAALQDAMVTTTTLGGFPTWSGGGGGGGGGRGSGGAGRGFAQRSGSGGGQRQQQQRSRESPSPQQLREWYAGRQRGGGAGPCTYVLRTGDRAGELCGGLHSTQRCFGRLTDAWQSAALGAGETAALGASASAAPGAGESALSGTASAQVLLTFTLDSGASRSFFRDRTTLTPLSRPVAVSLADPSGGHVLASFSTVLPCPATPSGTLSGLYLPWFSANLVSGADLQDQGVDQFTPASQRVAASRKVFAAPSRSGPESAPCSCRLLSHQTLLWHHRLGHLLPCPCLWSPPVPPSPSSRACPHLRPLCRGAAAQTLHMDVWGPARVRGQGHGRYFLLVVDDYSRYTMVFPLRSKGDVTEVLINWIRAARLQLRESFGSHFPVLRLHSDRGGEFSSARLGAFCRAQGIRQTFTLPASPQQNGIAERCIGMVMDVARTSMIHAAAPHFLWPFAVQYAAHQLNLQPPVSLPETSPTLLWTGKVGDASAFRVWGSRAFVRDLSADKLSPRAVPCVFLGFPPDAPGWQFYHPTSRRVLSSQDVTFDESVPYYRLFPYRTVSLPPPPLFLAPGSSLPLRSWRSSRSPGGAESGGAGSARVASRGASSRREFLSPQELREWFARRWSRAAGAGGTTAAAGSGGARPGGAGAAGPSGAAEAAGVGPTGVSTGASGGTGVAVSPGTRTAGATGAGAAGSVGAGVGAVGAGGAAGAGAAAERTGAVPTGSGGATRPRLYFVQLLEQVLGLPPSTGPTPPFESPPPVQSQSQLQPVSPLPAPSPYTGPTGGLAELRALASRPASPVRTARTSRRAPRPRPPAVPGTHEMALRPSTAPLRVPLPSPPESSLPFLADPESDSLHAASPTVARLLAAVVTYPSLESTATSALVAELVDFAARCRLDYVASIVAESESVCPPSVGGECALSTDVLEDRQEEFQCFAAALPHLVSTLIAPEGDPDAPDIPTPRSYAEAIEGPNSTHWQSAMDAEMASWKSTGTYVDEVPPPGANIISGMWIFRVKRPPGSPPDFKACYVARGFSSLHEEIWLRRPPGFTGSFPPGTQWSLRRPVYLLRQAPREWHDTLRTTLAALGFAPSTADPSLFLRTDTSLPQFYILVYVDDLVFATAGLAHVKSELQKRHTCTDLGELRSYLGLQITRDRAQRTITLTQSHMVQQVLQRFDFTYSSPQATPLSTHHSLSALPSDESVEPSGPYPELVGCLMYLMTCTRPDLAYPLSILARYVAPGRHRPEHMAAAMSTWLLLVQYVRLGASAWRATSSGPHRSRRCFLG
ncbi:unnamed protein product [Closterium sp. NIES-54]